LAWLEDNRVPLQLLQITEEDGERLVVAVGGRLRPLVNDGVESLENCFKTFTN
jgi:hypothetical protein